MKLDCLYEAIKRNRNPFAAVKVDNDFVSYVLSHREWTSPRRGMTNITPQISKKGFYTFSLNHIQALAILTSSLE